MPHGTLIEGWPVASNCDVLFDMLSARSRYSPSGQSGGGRVRNGVRRAGSPRSTEVACQDLWIADTGNNWIVLYRLAREWRLLRMSDEHRNATHLGHAHRARVSIEVGNERGDSLRRFPCRGSCQQLCRLGGSDLHAASLNTGNSPREGIRTYWTAPFIRQLLNFPYGLRPEVADTLSEHERALMGFRTWETYGTSDEFGAVWARPGKDNTGELR